MNRVCTLYRPLVLMLTILWAIGNLQAQEDSVVKEKHIYDSSENFFNWREEIDEAYYVAPANKNQRTIAKIAAYKRDKDFWYVDAVEKLENKYVLYEHIKDSLDNAKGERKDVRNSKVKQGSQNDEMMDEEVSVIMGDQHFFTPAVWVTIFLLLIVLFAGFIFLNKDNVLLRRNSRIKDDTGKKTEENIFSIPYAAAITNAEQAGDYTKAIRLRYLEIIRLMSEASVIQYQPDFTNMDYLAQLRRSKYLEGFITVTRHYEFSWYGKLLVTEATYKKIKEDFTAFKTILV